MKILNWKTGFSRCYFNFFFQPIRRCSSRSRDMTKPLDQYYSLLAHLTFYFTFFSGFRRNFLILRWLKKKKNSYFFLKRDMDNFICTHMTQLASCFWRTVQNEHGKVASFVVSKPTRQVHHLWQRNMSVQSHEIAGNMANNIFWKKRIPHGLWFTFFNFGILLYARLLWTEPKQLWGGDSGFDRS